MNSIFLRWALPSLHNLVQDSALGFNLEWPLSWSIEIICSNKRNLGIIQMWQDKTHLQNSFLNMVYLAGKDRLRAKEENKDQSMSRFSHESYCSQPLSKASQTGSNSRKNHQETPPTLLSEFYWPKAHSCKLHQMVGVTYIPIQLYAADTGLCCDRFSELDGHTPAPHSQQYCFLLAPAPLKCMEFSFQFETFNLSSHFSFNFLIIKLPHLFPV